MRIKFLDTGEELEVTEPEQLANTKVMVTPETSRQIQEAAFKLGYRWPDRKSGPNRFEAKYLFLGEWGTDYTVTLEYRDAVYFKKHKGREFQFLPSQPQQIQRGETGWMSAKDRLPIDDILSLDQAWPLHEVLGKLIEATDILLHEKNYDGHGWEETSFALKRARQILSLFTISEGQRGEITPEALKAEGWDKTLVKGDITVTFDKLDKMSVVVFVQSAACKGCKTMTDLLTLDRLVNGKPNLCYKDDHPCNCSGLCRENC